MCVWLRHVSWAEVPPPFLMCTRPRKLNKFYRPPNLGGTIGAPVSMCGAGGTEELAAVRWGTGLPNPTDAAVRRLACDLSPEEGNELIAKHKQTVEKSKLGPRPGDGCLVWKDKGVRRDITLRQKMGDAAVFARWLAKSSIDYRTSIPYGSAQAFLRECSAKPLSAKARRQGQDYLGKALKLYTSGAVETRADRHVKKI